ncbi:MAG: FtsX-like permease family protein [Clostridiales bacterium]|nr:FtsX-like permease family protein [Clostridiales bacterium]
MRPYAKTILRSVRMTLPRFLAIFAIIALGVGFFAGLKVTTPSFIVTGNKYINDYALYDFKLLSTIGFTDEDIEELSSRTSCVVEGSYTADCSAFLGDNYSADTVRFISITRNVNKLDLVTGRLPEKDDEIVIDAYMFPEFKLGTKLVIADETSSKSREMFKYDEYTVVGTARSPIFMNFQRGTCDEGSGNITYYVCALPGAFDSEYYTEAYLYANTGLFIYSDEYKDWAANAEKKYKVALRGVINDRFESLLKEEYDKLYDGIDEFNEGIDDARDELNDARAKLDDAKKQLEDAQAEIDKNRDELADAKKTLDDTAKTLAEYNKELTSQKTLLDAANGRLDREQQEMESLKSEVDSINQELTDARSDLFTARTTTQARIDTVSYLLDTYRSALTSVETAIGNNQTRLDEATSDFDKLMIQAQIDAQNSIRDNYLALIADAESELGRLNDKVAGFDDRQKEIDDLQKQYEAKIASYNEVYQSYMSDKITVETGYKDYETSKSQYDSAYSQYAAGLAQYKDGAAKLDEAQKKVDDGWKEYHDGVYELWKGYSEFSSTADSVYNSQLVYGFALIDGVDDPETYILGRSTNVGYVCFDNDAQIVDGVSTVFPVFFFMIAALVCSTTMSRMVSDERGIIGTMRALGYSDTSIVMKYAIYAGSASVLGCVLGFMGGTKLFPWAIWEVYKMMYGFAPLTFKTSVPLFIISLIVSLLCTVGVSVVTAASALKGMPAELIRPKAPLPGKRIFLEYVGFIWKRMKFLHKVSLRNVFRFKKRMGMMIVGIAGCTSLLITAFGLNDSICNLVDVQYDEIMKYDVSLVFDDKYRQYEIEEAAVNAGQAAGVNYDYAVVKSEQAKNGGSGYVRDIGMFISDDPNIEKIFGLSNEKTGEKIPWPSDGEVAVSQKLAEKNNVKVGDNITVLYGEDEHEVSLKVGSIFNNYTFHYVMMTPATYKAAFGKPYTPETLLIATESKDKADGIKFASYLSENYELKTWSLTADSRLSFANTMERLNYVIVLVIASAAALAFIVLFNLNNINITERIREIATLKVMGFNRRETGAYVTRENIMLVSMGYVVGIPLGILLHRFVMSQIAMDIVKYDIRILPLSYLYSLAFVLFFSTIVNLIMRAKIEKIDMAESLKSAE